MRVTHAQIAKDLGISRAAVTQALHGTRSSNLRPELRREVLSAARRLGYQPFNRTTHTIAYVMEFNTMKLAGEHRQLMLTEQALRRAGYRLSISSVHGDELESLRESLTPKTVDGVIFTRWFRGQIKDLLSPEVPWVMTSDEDGVSPEVDMVTVDTQQAAEMLTRYLIGFGHEKICLVTGKPGLGFHERQKAGARAALLEAGLPASNLRVVELFYDHEIAAVLRPILRGPDRPTAIIGAGPEKTLTILNLLCHEGILVPDDVSIVSLMDSELLEPIIPPVTTTNFGSELAELAVERLVQLIQAPPSEARHVRVPTRMIERQSVALVRPIADKSAVVQSFQLEGSNHVRVLP